MRLRITVGLLSVVGLIVTFLFQRINVAAALGIVDPSVYQFMFNRFIRYLLNDAFTFGLIYALFKERKYLIFSLWVQVFGIFFLLGPYFILKLYYPGYNGPLISFLHRLILNPTLLLLLIPAFYYQRKMASA